MKIMPAFVMKNVCASKLVRKCFIQQKQVPPMHIYLANNWKLVLPPAVSISFFFRRFLFKVITIFMTLGFKPFTVLLFRLGSCLKF